MLHYLHRWLNIIILVSVGALLAAPQGGASAAPTFQYLTAATLTTEHIKSGFRELKYRRMNVQDFSVCSVISS